MNTEFLAESKTFVVSPVGRITTSEVGSFAAAFAKMPEATQSIVVDMQSVEYISSSCLRVLLSQRQKFDSNDCVRLLNCNSSICEVIKATGFDCLMQVSAGGTDFDFGRASFADVLSYRVKNNPEDVFLTYCGKNYTWRDIDAYSRIIARDLRLKGVKELSHIGIVGANSCNFLLTFFALQKLGAIAVLFNDKLTAEEISEQCRIGDVTAMCMGNLPAEKESDIANALAGSISFVYDISDRVDFTAGEDAYEGIGRLFPEKVLSDNPALMIFSSGSTGKPKAVLLSAGNLLCDAADQCKKWHITEQDCLCLAIPLFHIFSFKTGFAYSVVMNNRICITENSRTKTIIETVEREKCTLFHAVPTLMLAVLSSAAFSAHRFASLRVSVLAGAALPKPQMLTVMQTLPHVSIVNLYGLSEINPLSSTAYGDSAERICDSVGTVAPGVTARIIRLADKRECKLSESGEILARGEHSFLCYYKLPAESQAMDAEGFVHTGDLGYMDDSGYLHLTGRIKEIIIRGGENILPSEIVNAIAEFENIREVAVIGVPDDFYGECVGACLSLKDKASWDEKKLNGFLASKLAPFKIPSKYLIFDELPKLGNGKPDRETMKKALQQA